MVEVLAVGADDGTSAVEPGFDVLRAAAIIGADRGKPAPGASAKA
jgi:hypothetical protein